MDEENLEENNVVNDFVKGSVNESFNESEKTEKQLKNATNEDKSVLVNATNEEENVSFNAANEEENVLFNAANEEEKIENEEVLNALESDEELQEEIDEELEEEELEEKADTMDFDEEEESEIELDDFDQEEGFEEDQDEEFDFPDDEEDEDVLGSYQQEAEEEKKVEDVVNDATNGSAKNLEALKDLGELVIEFMDDSKAHLCAAISGQPASKYASGKKMNKALLKAFIAYMDSQEVKAPSPMGTLLLTLALWGLPALGTAYFHRRQLAKKKKEQEALNQTANEEPNEEQEVEGEAISDEPESTNIDYSQTKEFKGKRTMFDVHASTGCYCRDLEAKYVNVNLAKEQPSPEIKTLIDQNQSNPQIRSILYPS